MRAEKDQRSCYCFQSIQKPSCDKDRIEALYAEVWIKKSQLYNHKFLLKKVKDVKQICTNSEIPITFSSCNKALKMAAGEIGYCARDSVDGIRAPWTVNHDDMDDVVEEDVVVESRWMGLCSLNF